ncbi:insulinase family protein [Sphingomonas cannabina]|uniref:M16 family metallopeptidase n=1 Tax=Sphingomonas cannabina TaxID=2899123 RepID=UPI001F2D982E|nr:pitrilysin family protein [Sphingomonas cannabina]UIJ45175.1 insulinase family protein [Sphingomonas cannabina]
MKLSHMLSGVALLALSAPAMAQEAKPVPVAELVREVNIPYEQFTLPNGLRVIVHTDRKAPIVAVSVWYDIGSKNEPKGKTGFAHLFEHLMFNGSENSPGDFFVPLQEVGATDFNGTTWFDRTNYFETVPTPALERALYLESDRMGHLLGAVTQDKLDNQRGVVQNEKRQGDNEPYGLVEYAQIEGLLPPDHPYGHTTIGSMADLDAASLADVKKWFRDHYGPNNAVLVLAGDIDAAAARPLVAKYFGDIPAGPKTAPVPTTIPTLPGPKAVTMKDRVANVRLYRYWTVPGLNDKDSVPLNVFASVLGGLASSRLDNTLVRKDQLAVSASASVQDFAQLGFFEIQVNVKPGVDPALVNKRLDEIFADLLKNGPTADEVQRVAMREVSSTIEGLEQVGDFGGKAVALAEGALYSNDPGFYKKQLAAYASATPESVRAAAQKWLSRPVFALTVEPGPRAAYTEAAVAAKPAEAAPEAPVKGTRGPLPAVGEISNLAFPKVERTKLSNGIELVYAQRTAVPITRAALSFDAGIAADVPGKLGTQSLMLASLEEGGTKSLDPIALAEAQERLGMEITSASTPDRTTVAFEAPSANLSPALGVLSDVVRTPAFAAPEVTRVRNQLLAQIAAELTNPSGLASRTSPPLLYGTASPYAKAAAGSGDPKAVATLAPADLRAFHDAWLRPEKLKVFIVSDRPLAEVRQAFESRFGDWRGTGAPGTKDFAAAAQQSAPKVVLVDRPDSPQSMIVAGQLTRLKGTDELLPYTTANDVLSGNFLSRVNMDLRETKGWTYGSYGTFRRLENAVPFTITTPVQADRTGDSIKAIQLDVREFLTTKGVTPEEFGRTIAGFVRELSGSFETSSAVLSAMQMNDLAKRPDDYYSTIAQKYRALTAPQLDAAAREALDPNRFVWVVVGDAAKVRPQLDSVGLPVEVVPAPGAQPAAAASN